MYKKTFWGFTVLALVIAFAIWLLYQVPIQLGIDLRGGTELTYRLDLSLVETSRADVGEQVKNIISRRLNAYGLKEINVSVQGDDHLVVQLPGTDAQSVSDLKRQVETAGELEFRLVASPSEETQDKQAQYQRLEREYDEKLRVWIASDRSSPRPIAPAYIVRPVVEKENANDPRSDFKPTGSNRTLVNDEDSIISGKFLSRVGPTRDQSQRPAVHFEFSGNEALRFHELTRNNIDRGLAILLDEDILQIANIDEAIPGSGQLSGDFSDQDVQGIVTILRGGSMPTKPRLISEMTVGSVVGQDSILTSLYAVVCGLMAVMAVMAVYYLFAGCVANFAVALNVLLILAYIACFRQTLTLPGIAGILLTVGMAVDANILIFERVREEKKKGKSLLQSLSTGYQRAFWVIFDANLTTLITGFVLFNFGTGPVKGFAVTLISGILISFVTAIFVTRLIVSLFYNLGLVKNLKMFEAFDTPKIGFVSVQRRFLMLSVVVILITSCLVLFRGKANYGIDFTGGARINMQLSRAVSISEMKEKIDALKEANPDLFLDYGLQTIGGDGGEARAFSLRTRVKEEGVSIADAQEPAAAPEAETPETTPPAVAPATGNSAPVARDAVEEVSSAPAAVEGDAQKVRVVLEEMLRSEGLLLPPLFPVSNWSAASGVGQETQEFLTLEVNFLWVSPDLTEDSIKESIQAEFSAHPLLGAPTGADAASGYSGIQVAEVKLLETPPPAEDGVSRYRFVTAPYSPPPPGAARSNVPTKEQVVDAFRTYFQDHGPAATAAGNKRHFELSEPFSEVSTVGPSVATNLQQDAIIALFISMLGIIFYVSLRFEFIFGLAAIVALIHDIAITIGVVAVVDTVFGATFPVKINLAELAALLTIIGYSINDTIVVFDRIRENLQIHAKKRLSFKEIVDLSINQTLSRTLWTSVTTLIATSVLILFATEAVRGFTFIFMVGIITGTYSSVFVASPVLIWLHARAQQRREALANA